MKALDKILTNKRICVFMDFEGTQFSHEIVAVGAVKCYLDEHGNIIKEEKGFKAFVKAINPIGNYISKMTSISDEFLKEKGITVDRMLKDFEKYVNEDFSNVIFLVFGNNDAKMLHETKKYSKPKKEDTINKILKNLVDYQMFLSQFCRDENLNNYSLVNYLKLFKGLPNGESHDPLNDAIDLKNLYKQVLKNKEILINEYKSLLNRQKIYAEPIKIIIERLMNGENITSDEFENLIQNYLS